MEPIGKKGDELNRTSIEKKPSDDVDENTNNNDKESTILQEEEEEEESNYVPVRFFGPSAADTEKPIQYTTCSRFCAELLLPPFQLEEVDGKYLDVPATFSPRPLWLNAILKLLMLTWCVGTLTYGIYETVPDEKNHTYYYFYRMDHWNLLLMEVYFAASLFHVVRPPIATSSLYAPFFVKWTWKMFAIVTPAALIITFFYWAAVFDGDVTSLTWETWSLYGGLYIALLVDGFVLNRIPIRASQHWYSFAYFLLHIGWTYLHEILKLGNPESQYNLLYRIVQWKVHPEETTVVCASVILIFVPTGFLVTWLLSLFACCKCSSGPQRRSCCSFQGLHRRYVDNADARKRLIDV